MKHCLIKVSRAALLALLVSTASAQDSKEWASWRGPNATFSVTDAEHLLPNRTYRLRTAWKKPLGSGYAPVSISGGVAVTGFSDEENNYYGAFDADTGEERWRVRTGAVFPGRFGAVNGPIAPPLIAGQRVFVLDNAGAFFALDLATGQKIWQVDFVKDLGAPVPFYGYSTAPLEYQDSVIVQTGGKGALTRFDAATGKLIWRSAEVNTRYQTPTLTEIDGKAQVVLLADQHLAGIDPDSGKVLWQGEHGAPSTPVGSWTSNPVLTAADRVLVKTVRGSSLFSVPSGGRAQKLEEVWNTRDLKNTYVVSVVHDGVIFGFNNRILNAVDAKDGQRLWRSRDPGDGFPIVVNDNLILITKDGKLSMAPASRDGYEEAASLQVFDELVWTPPTYIDGRLYLRSFNQWARVDIVESEDSILAQQNVAGKLPKSAFGRMIAGLESLGEAQRKSQLDEFMARHNELPITEGQDIVHFLLRSPAEDVGLVSDLFGGRTDRSTHRLAGTDLHYFSMRVEPGTRVNYAFLTDFGGQPIADPLNPREAKFQPNASVLAMPGWSPPPHLDEAPEDQRGSLEKKTLESGLRGRDIELDVYLPHGFSPDRHYPVAYVLDSNDRLRHSMKNTLDNLVGQSVEPLIVVFVPYFGPQGLPAYFEYVDQGVDPYVRVLMEEIIPFVDSSYPTSAQAQERAFLGRMNTTYSSIYAVLQNPGVVGKLGLQTMRWEPGLRPRNRAMLLDAPEQELRIYLDWGKYDGKSEMEGFDARAFSIAFGEDLKAAGYTFTGGEVLDGSGPDSWVNRTDKVLETLFPLED